MITKEDEYVANLFKVIGIGMTTPVANLLLFPIKLFSDLGAWGFSIYLLISIGSFFLGYKFIDGGRAILYKQEKNK